MDSDLYARNPARDVEQYAVRVVAAWLGDRGSLTDTSAGHGPDFRITYADGRVAFGEVGWHEDPQVQEMWANTFKHDQHQLVNLPSGLGQWAVSLERGANIGRLYADLPALVAALAEAGCPGLAVYENWPQGEAADTARRLGVRRLARLNLKEPAAGIFLMPGSGGVVPTDANAVTDWVEAVLANPAYHDTSEKLLAIHADERHVFLMSGSLTPFGADERLRRLQDSLPTRSPCILAGITHVWIVARFGGTAAGLWLADHGWSAVSLDDDGLAGFP